MMCLICFGLSLSLPCESGKTHNMYFMGKNMAIPNILAHVAALGPVVQRIVSLTRSLRGQLIKCFRTL